MQPLISVVLSFRNEEEMIPLLVHRCGHALRDLCLPLEPRDFRRLSRSAAQISVSIDDKNLYIRRRTWWLGRKQKVEPYSRGPRAAGQSRFIVLGRFEPIREFMNGVLLFSVILTVYIMIIGTLLRVTKG